MLKKHLNLNFLKLAESCKPLKAVEVKPGARFYPFHSARAPQSETGINGLRRRGQIVLCFLYNKKHLFITLTVYNNLLLL